MVASCIIENHGLNFVFKKSTIKFSSIACNLAHKQTNKLIKTKYGLADVSNEEDTRFLKKI